MQELPHWLLAIGTGEIVALVSMLVTTGAGVVYLIYMHRNPMRFRIGTEKTEAQNKEIISIQKKMHRRISQQLHISLWQGFAHAESNGGIFPEWAKELLKSGLLLKEDD